MVLGVALKGKSTKMLAGKIIISDVQQFAEYVNSIIKTHVLYLDKSMIISHNLNSAIYVQGTLKIHHVM